MGEVYPELQHVLTAGVEGVEPGELAMLFPTCGQYIARSGYGPLPDSGLYSYEAGEIEPAIEVMEAQGFQPTSFTIPWGGQTDDLVDALFGHFEIVRGSGSLGGIQDVRYTADDGRLTNGARLDEGWWTENQLDAALRRADRNGSVLVLYAHRILEESDKSHVTPASLETALALIDERGLPHLTLTELLEEP
jgi:hypothetical protein